jgi:hypothetical protein
MYKMSERLAEAVQIENEWNAMSYKDRAAWWVSAKWYGYMSTEAYRRGDPINPNISCRYGEPGFFIATRVPYFETNVATVTTAPTTTTIPETTAPTTTTIPETTAPTETAPTTIPETTAPTETAPTTIPETTNPSATTGIIASVEPPVAAATTTDTVDVVTSATGNINKKKKKKQKHATKSAGGEGKTIEIRLGAQSK